ncbi:MAG: hypothetical protein M3N12_01045 [Verrucomicrobiota bacterium]|nr:hypothetical protein [Verrucomicrobiota bacterium]
MVGADQWLNIVFIVPVIFVFNAGSALAIYARPQFFIQRQGHLILIALQAIGLLFYLASVLRAFIKFIPLILATRQEWRTTAESA